MTAGTEFITWLGQVAVVGLGWWVVHRLSASRDLDKARRELVAKSADGLSDETKLLEDFGAGHPEVKSTREQITRMEQFLSNKAGNMGTVTVAGLLQGGR